MLQGNNRNLLSWFDLFISPCHPVSGYFYDKVFLEDDFLHDTYDYSCRLIADLPDRDMLCSVLQLCVTHGNISCKLIGTFGMRSA